MRTYRIVVPAGVPLGMVLGKNHKRLKKVASRFHVSCWSEERTIVLQGSDRPVQDAGAMVRELIRSSRDRVNGHKGQISTLENLAAVAHGPESIWEFRPSDLRTHGRAYCTLHRLKECERREPRGALEDGKTSSRIIPFDKKYVERWLLPSVPECEQHDGKHVTFNARFTKELFHATDVVTHLPYSWTDLQRLTTQRDGVTMSWGTNYSSCPWLRNIAQHAKSALDDSSQTTQVLHAMVDVNSKVKYQHHFVRTRQGFVETCARMDKSVIHSILLEGSSGFCIRMERKEHVDPKSLHYKLRIVEKPMGDFLDAPVQLEVKDPKYAVRVIPARPGNLQTATVAGLQLHIRQEPSGLLIECSLPHEEALQLNSTQHAQVLFTRVMD